MNNQLKKFSSEIKEQMQKAFSSADFQTAIKSIKDASQDNGTFEVIISTADVDRSGDIIDQNGWDLSNYLLNPVVLWAHDYSALPIGVCDTIKVVGDTLVATGRFAGHAFAQEVRKLYDAKMLRTTSVGFIVIEADGNKITKQELLEFSFVTVPANPFALSMRQVNEMGINVEMLKAKGIDINVKSEEDTIVCPECGNECKSGDKFCSKCGASLESKKDDKEVEKKEKGAISDELNEDEVWEKKWGYLDQLYDIINAFYNVYLDEGTPVEQFNPLLIELISLLQQVADGTYKDPDDGAAVDDKSIKGIIKSKSFKGEYVLKEGKVLSDSNKELIKKAVDALNAILAASESKAINTDQPADGLNTRSKNVSKVDLNNLNDYLTVQKFLREINKTVESSLTTVKSKIREKNNKLS